MAFSKPTTGEPREVGWCSIERINKVGNQVQVGGGKLLPMTARNNHMYHKSEVTGEKSELSPIEHEPKFPLRNSPAVLLFIPELRSESYGAAGKTNS